MGLITRKGGAGVTILVPYDCLNNCPFCINKELYRNTEDFSIKKIQDAILIIDSITPECDIAISGGEPLADLDGLQIILDTIPDTHRVFIDTTLPVNHKYSMHQLSDFLNQNYKAGKLNGINCSRHIRHYIEECNDDIFDLLCFNVRINCVVFKEDTTAEEIISFVNRFKTFNSYIEFRKDYVCTTDETLYDHGEDNLWILMNKLFEYKGIIYSNKIRCSYEFDYKGYKVVYYKCLPYGKVDLGNGDFEINDIIIKPTGEICDDWDICADAENRKHIKQAQALDLNAYRNAQNKPYF